MSRIRRYGLLAGFALTLAGLASLAATATATAVADEERVALKDVPDFVLEAAKRAAPEARWVKATKEVDDETTYVVKGAGAKGLKVSVGVSADGEVDWVESALCLADLPKAVADVVKGLPDLLWDSGNQTVSEGETTYELYGSDLEDRDVTLSIDADGRASLRTELELDDVPAVVSNALKTSLPNFTPDSVVSVSEGGKVITYEFEGDGLDNDETKVSVSADGKTVKVGDEDNA
jgi:hypothetical protein